MATPPTHIYMYHLMLVHEVLMAVRSYGYGLLVMVIIVFCYTDETEEIWHESDDAVDDFEPSNVAIEDIQEENIDQKALNLVGWITGFFSFLQAVYQVSDTVTGLMIRFIKVLMCILGQFCSVCSDIAKILPTSIYKFTKNANLQFRRYVVCRKCHSVYFYHDCVDVGLKSKLCIFKPFPHHPHMHMRQNCNNLLLKTVELSSGKRLLYPFMTYCYMSIESSLQRFLQRPSFYTLCQEWRNRSTKDGLLCDVYDGQIWKEFEVYKGMPFLSEPFTFGLMINIDWFQPYKHVQYSVGAIYISILNLPRLVRNKLSIIMLVGIIPGPREPSRNANSFIEPLVSELNTFWHGIEMNIHGYSS